MQLAKSNTTTGSLHKNQGWAKDFLRDITKQLYLKSALPRSSKMSSSFSMGVTEEGDIYPIMILASPPLICRPGWQTRTDRNATWDEADWVTTKE